MDALTLVGQTHRIDNFHGETVDVPHLKVEELIAWIDSAKHIPDTIKAYATSPGELIRLAGAWPDELLWRGIRKERKSTTIEQVRQWQSMEVRSLEAHRYMLRMVRSKEEDSYPKKKAVGEGSETDPSTTTGQQKKPSSQTSTAETPSKT